MICFKLKWQYVIGWISSHGCHLYFHRQSVEEYRMHKTASWTSFHCIFFIVSLERHKIWVLDKTLIRLILLTVYEDISDIVQVYGRLDFSSPSINLNNSTYFMKILSVWAIGYITLIKQWRIVEDHASGGSRNAITLLPPTPHHHHYNPPITCTWYAPCSAKSPIHDPRIKYL